MLKKLIKLSILLLFILIIPMSTVASGKMEVKLGEKVTLQSDDVTSGSSYKWVIKKGSEIINTQTNSIFSYTFMEQGEYNVTLTVTDSANKVRSTTIYMLAGDRYPRPTVSATGEIVEGGAILPPEKQPLTVSFSTLPLMGADNAVHLIEEGKVLFDIEVLRDDILEYRIDRNIFEDTDGDGVANNDIDNSNDNSYLVGGIWETEYKSGEATKIVAEITLVTKEGEKTKSQVEILFDQPPRRDGDPLAILETIPSPSSEDKLVHLYDDPSDVAFYCKKSEGKILEFRIDKNIFVDSDGDGNPSNDIDNLNDISFKTGDVWRTEYPKTDGQIIAQLIVVGEGGKGSRIQRGMVFSEKPKIPAITEEQEAIKLTADKTLVMKGDPINFAVEGLTQALSNYTFAWDFNGDGTTDMETEGNNQVTYIYDVASAYTVKVIVTDKQENTANFTVDIVVKDVVATMADFELQVEGNTVKFTDKSIVAMELTNKNLNYTWNFGDTDEKGYEAQKDQIGLQNPSYTYNKAGKYVISLTVTDADQVTDTKTAEVTIEQDLPTEQPAVEQPAAQGGEQPASAGGSVIGKILKVILYLILVIIILAIAILLGFFVFLKVQNPDLTFEEIVDEIKIKILAMLGVHEMLEKPVERPAEKQEAVPLGADKTKEEEEVLEGEVTEPAKKEAASTPDWLKETAKAPEEKKAEDEEEKSDAGGPATPSGTAAPLDKQTGPVPDWLKH
jgi:PKD repeat protein